MLEQFSSSKERSKHAQMYIKNLNYVQDDTNPQPNSIIPVPAKFKQESTLGGTNNTFVKTERSGELMLVTESETSTPELPKIPKTLRFENTNYQTQTHINFLENQSEVGRTR
jgi:hypothetical protein